MPDHTQKLLTKQTTALGKEGLIFLAMAAAKFANFANWSLGMALKQ